MASSALDGGLTVITDTNEVSKGESEVLNSNALFVEDRFMGLYEGGLNTGRALQPPYNPDTLTLLAANNNTLLQCINAMEVNIDGTGFSLLGSEESKSSIADFLAEPYPNKSMTTIRKALRRDLEITGNAYLEVIRNLKGDITLLNIVPSVTMRLCRLSSPIKTKKTLHRKGTEIQVTLNARQRVFVQKVGITYTYFKEYGSSSFVDSSTGIIGAEGKKGGATEILHYTNTLDGTSPYGSPRWINQMPSVLGSRKAEEHNLDFFNSGGLPPVLITVAGGTMVTETKKALNDYLNGKGAKNRAAILEAYASGTSIDSSGSVKISVERFGSERQSDSMFENYDSKCEERIRSSFRLPELYVGRNTGNFAASRAASMLAEAQVFKPERAEFDEVMNLTIIRELSGGKVRMISKQNTLKDGNLQMKGIAVARSTGAVNPESIVDNISEVSGIDLAFDANELAHTREKNKTAATDSLARSANAMDAGKGLDKPNPEKVIKTIKVDGLAYDWGQVALGESALERDDLIDLQSIVEGLEGEDVERFNNLLAERVFPECEYDKEGAAEIARVLADIEVG